MKIVLRSNRSNSKLADFVEECQVSNPLSPSSSNNILQPQRVALIGAFCRRACEPQRLLHFTCRFHLTSYFTMHLPRYGHPSCQNPNIMGIHRLIPIFMDCSQFDDRCSFIPTHIVFNGNVFKCLEIFCSRQFDHHIGPRNMSDRSRRAEHPVTKTPCGWLAPELTMAGSAQRLRIQSS